MPDLFLNFLLLILFPLSSTLELALVFHVFLLLSTSSRDSNVMKSGGLTNSSFTRDQNHLNPSRRRINRRIDTSEEFFCPRRLLFQNTRPSCCFNNLNSTRLLEINLFVNHEKVIDSFIYIPSQSNQCRYVFQLVQIHQSSICSILSLTFTAKIFPELSIFPICQKLSYSLRFCLIR